MDIRWQFEQHKALVETGISPEAADAIIRVALEVKAAYSQEPTPNEPSKISSELYNEPASRGDIEALQQTIKLEIKELHWKLVVYLVMLASTFLVVFTAVILR